MGAKSSCPCYENNKIKCVHCHAKYCGKCKLFKRLSFDSSTHRRVFKYHSKHEMIQCTRCTKQVAKGCCHFCKCIKCNHVGCYKVNSRETENCEQCMVLYWEVVDLREYQLKYCRHDADKNSNCSECKMEFNRKRQIEEEKKQEMIQQHTRSNSSYPVIMFTPFVV